MLSPALPVDTAPDPRIEAEILVNASTHQQRANFIWKTCNLLRGPYKRNEYRKVILPLTVLRRFDVSPPAATMRRDILACCELESPMTDTLDTLDAAETS